jgi:YVTN family beta-propeller protein
MAAGHGGQVLLSSTTRDLAEDELPADVALRDLGEQRLKDLDRPVRLYQVAAPGLLDLFPPLRTLDTERAGRGPSRLPRRVLIPVATLVGAAIAVGVVFATRSGGTGGTVVASNSVGLIDPKANKVVGEIGVGIRPGSLAVGAGSVWVANEEDKTLSHILVATRSVKRSIPLDATPTGVAQADGAVWVAEGPAGALARVDPQFETVVKTIPGLAGAVRVSGSPSGSVTVGDGKVWVAYGSSTVAGINPTTNAVAASGFAGRDPVAIAYGEGAVWIANQGDNSVSKFSVTTDSTVYDVSVGQGPSGVAVGGGAVWVSDADDDAVSRVDPTSRASRTIAVGRGPVGIAYGEGAVWVANSKDGTVSRIDPETGSVVKTIKVGGRPVGIAVGGGLVWVTVQ